MISSLAWSHSIKVDYEDRASRWRPKPDSRFEYKGTIVPLLVYESASKKNGSDRWRLLGQCKVFLRLAEKLGMRVCLSGQARPVVMACYMPSDMMLEVYLMTTMDDSSDVRIFDLQSCLFTLILDIGPAQNL